MSEVLAADYPIRAGTYDDMLQSDGTPRPGWRSVFASPEYLSAETLAQRWRDAERQIRENGITYNIYGDPKGMARPWPLDPMPQIIEAQEWQKLEAGLIQRARLLEAVARDIHGRQTLLRSGIVPPGVIFGNPGFLRACHGIEVPGGVHLPIIGVDLARQTDGSWIVLGDRTQAPPGMGHALENRMVMSSCMPDAIASLPVQRLAGFFRTLRRSLGAAASMAARRSRGSGAEPRIVLLTPGPCSETYFEHAYLSRYLGYPLVAGEDLTVRHDRVYLKTLAGLQPVDAILRRLDDDWCDPLHLKSSSTLGVAGLVGAVRRGHVALANRLGSGVLEAPALFAYLPQLAPVLLGETLALPQIPTRWLGAGGPLPADWDDVVVKPAYGGPHLADPAALSDQIAATPQAHAICDRLALSTSPVLTGDGRLEPRRMVMRGYIAAGGDEDWAVMPGALTLAGTTAETTVVSMQSGGSSKDTWVLTDQPIEKVTLWPQLTDATALRRTADLPSRAADNLFWLGRYAERGEVVLRLIRATLSRYLPDAGAGATAIPTLLTCLSAFHVTTPEPPIATALMMALDDDMPKTLSLLHRAATSVRDRLSIDAWRILNPFARLPRLTGRTVTSAVAEIEALMVRLAAFNGLAMENMTRGLGWRFLELGRRIERAYQTVAAARMLVGYPSSDETATLEALLEVCDSSMTYRGRYFTGLRAAAALDLVIADDTNPRAVAFQLAAITEHLRNLPLERRTPDVTTISHRMTTDCMAELRRADMGRLTEIEGERRPELERFAQALTHNLLSLSDALGETYFKHAAPVLDHGSAARSGRR
ncbi:MAG TPA: circularly permuted type 2 ATP-grasp protein [Stellaceae bacterium]|nr:circularly permuted type 2 ATP-grasp protein [Stellaceae bacterium]